MHAQSLFVARTVAEAVAALAGQGEGAAPLAGATWIMRTPIREEPYAASYVAIGGIGELRRVDISDREIVIGACATHVRIADALSGLADCRALAIAAASAANPAIRQVATIGGNLCTTAFAASDLVPALLCLDAEVEIATQDGTDRMPLAPFLAARVGMAPGTLLTRIVVRRSPTRSAHVRLPLRKAGDYPVAIVSMAAGLAPDGIVESARIAVGSVEPVARRWTSLEDDLVGHPLDPKAASAHAEVHAAVFEGRDGIEAPGWYRVEVLPSLVRRAVASLLDRS